MPQPPNIDEFDKIHFIVDYFWQGCSTDGFLEVNLSQPPEKNLVLLLIGLDMEDIVAGILAPKGGRNRRPGRHGRKKRPPLRFPDPNDMIGRKVRPIINPIDALKITPLKYIFPVYNANEAVNITAAVAEGLTDIGFDRIWGLITLNPNQCPNLAFFERRTIGNVDVIGAAPSPYAINLGQLVTNQGFFTPHGTGWGRDGREYSVATNIRVESIGVTDAENVRLQIVESNTGKIVDESGAFDLDVGDSIWISNSADMENGHYTHLARSSDRGSLRFSNGVAMGWANDRWKQ